MNFAYLPIPKLERNNLIYYTMDIMDSSSLETPFFVYENYAWVDNLLESMYAYEEEEDCDQKNWETFDKDLELGLADSYLWLAEEAFEQAFEEEINQYYYYCI